VTSLCVSVSQRTTAFVSQPERFRLHTHAIPPQSPRPGNSRGPYERFQYAGVEAKKATNRNDEAEGAQTEIHRSLANEGAEPPDPRHCRISAACRLACEPIRRRLRVLTDWYRRPTPLMAKTRRRAGGPAVIDFMSLSARTPTGRANLRAAASPLSRSDDRL
jgi:hypothetical protein